jgi:hypothetical protein
MENICWVGIDEIKPNQRNARTHSRKQINQIASSIGGFGFLVPLVIDEHGVIWAGHGRYAAAKQLGLEKVPVIKITGLSDAKLRAFALADNRIAAGAGWDRRRLAAELPELADILTVEGLDISITGFSKIQIDALAISFDAPEDWATEAQWSTSPPVSKLGDLWQLGQHRLFCGDPCNADHLTRLMQGGRAAMAFLNPPVNVFLQHEAAISSHGSIDGARRASFLGTALANAASASCAGAIHYVCTDWRHIRELIEIGDIVYGGEMLNLAVWVYSEADEGLPYGNQHRLIGIFRVGNGAGQPEIVRQQRRQKRSDVWRYAAPRCRAPDDTTATHQIPVELVADAMKDCTGRGDTVIDMFGGTGTSLVAAEGIGRVAFALETEPGLVDAAIRRWEALSGKEAFCEEIGLSFRELASRRTM